MPAPRPAARRPTLLQRIRGASIGAYKPGAGPDAPRYSRPPPMSAEYELVLMLDPETPDERRDEIAADARQRIESGGSLKAEKAWGMRKLAYEIRQRNEADYRFFRFETESPVLDELDHNLKITDGVLRFRIFKVDPDSPVIEPPPPAPLASSRPAPAAAAGVPAAVVATTTRSRDAAPAPAPAAETPAPAAAPAAAAARRGRGARRGPACGSARAPSSRARPRRPRLPDAEPTPPAQ